MKLYKRTHMCGELRKDKHRRKSRAQRLGSRREEIWAVSSSVM